MINELKPLLGKLCSFSQKRLGFERPPRLFLRNDNANSQKALGKTAYYEPNKETVTLFINKRHPKDILRSFAHELVHHAQNLRGDLSPEKMTNMGPNYTQKCPHMRNMEKEAYLKGNMCFRDWEDTIQDKDKILINLAESKFLKENKTMTTKITKDFLKEMIEKILLENQGTGKVIQMDPTTIKAGEKETEKEKESRKRIEKLPTIKALREPVKEEEEIEEITGLGDMAYAAENKPKLSSLEAEAMVRTMIDMFTDDNDGFGVMQTLDDLGTEMGRGKGNLGGEALAGLHKVYNALLKVNKRPGFGDEPDPSKTYTDEIGTDPSLTGTDNLEEGGCKTSPGMREDEELEEGKPEGKPDYIDLDGDGNKKESMKKAAADKKKKTDESKVQTPEQENALYEQRFTPKNNRLFEKLVKQWTK